MLIDAILILRVLFSSFVYCFQSGLIADELDRLKPELRSKLNEIKRAEIDRLLSRWRDLAKITDREPKGIVHLDTKNPHSFEADDLRYLLKAV